MQKFIKKFISFFIILSVIIPEGFWGTSFAISNVWDFTNEANYTFSNTGELNVLWWIGKIESYWQERGNIASWPAFLDGANDIVTSWNYAYVASYNNNGV